MSIIACALSLILFLLSLFFNKNKKSISPTVLFFALWFFILFLSILNLYGIYKPSNEAYFLIILMLSFFALGSSLYALIKKKNIKLPKIIVKEQQNDKKTIKPMFKLFYIFSFLLILFYIIDLIIIIKELIAGTPMWQIRNWSLEPYGSINPILSRRSFLEESFRTIILTPFATIIPPITAYYFFNSDNNKQKYKLLIISLTVLLLSSIAGGGGRLGFIYYFGCFLLAFFIAYKNRKNSNDVVKKYKKIMIFLLVFGLLFIVAYTAFRTGIGNLIKQIYTYFALPPTLLSIWLPKIKEAANTYGMTTFFGVHSYFFRILDTIGLEGLIPQIYNEAYTHILNAEIFLKVGYGIGNAFVTPIYYFFIDGGYPFVCIASLFFGYIVSNLHKKFEEDINIRSFTNYVLIMYGIFLTFIRIQTAIPSYIISFIFVFFILRKSKTKESNKNDELIDEKNTAGAYTELISVIVPIYKVEKYLNKCIDSIISQTYSNLEIILVDDGSPDECGKICDEYAKKDQRIKVIHKENAGVSSARNVGLDNSNGEYIAFIDSDDYVSNNYFEELLNTLKKENVDCVACGYNRIYNNSCEKNISEESYTLYDSELLERILFVQSGLGFCHTKLWKKLCIGDIRFNKELKVGEDALFNMVVSKNIKKFYMLNKELYNYRFNETSVVRKYDENYIEKYLKSMQVAKAYIENEYQENKNVINKLNNYIAYHVLLIIINYCANPKNNLNFVKQLNEIKRVCNIEEFKHAIKYSNYEGFSVTRKITLFTLKHKLYFLTGIIGKVRQIQFEKNSEEKEATKKDEKQ